MDLLEVKKLYEDNVRVMAQNLSEILKVQINRVYSWDDVLQDHLVFIKHSMGDVDERTSIDECLIFFKRFNQGMKNIEAQYKWNQEHFGTCESDESFISEMLVGDINYQLCDELADCARKVKKLFDEVLSQASRVRTDEEYKLLLNRFINGVIAYANEADVYVDKNFPFLYLQFWFKRKYFEEN